MYIIPQKMLDRIFTMLVGIACRGERAPQLQPHGVLTVAENNAILEMARAGRLRVEIFAHNWRVVTICEGQYRGRHTQLSPYKGGGEPYRVIQKGDVTAGQRGAPSLPRLLPYAGRG
jgi:hypothetical protein